MVKQTVRNIKGDFIHGQESNLVKHTKTNEWDNQQNNCNHESTSSDDSTSDFGRALQKFMWREAIALVVKCSGLKTEAQYYLHNQWQFRAVVSSIKVQNEVG